MSDKSGNKASVFVATLALVVAIFAVFNHWPPRDEAFTPSNVQDASSRIGVPSLAPMLKNVLPAVVNIAVTVKSSPEAQQLLGPGARRLFRGPDGAPQLQPNSPDAGQQGESDEGRSIGSGVVIDAVRGYIVTNNHVIDDAGAIKVKLKDDREFDAKLIGKDAASDLAVLQIEAKDLVQLSLADSDRIQVGDYVVAIGSPFALTQTVTSGIVSALGRDTPDGGDSIQDFIQTDASINPGNSGGALVNLKGELVGVPSQILSRSGGNMGIGFAIPANLVKSVMTQLIATGTVSRGRIGLGLQELTPQLAKVFGLADTHGALVTEVAPGAPAEKAGVKPRDVVVSANGHGIQTLQQLRNYVGSLKVGDRVTLKVIREGNSREIVVEIGTAPQKAVAEDGKVTISKLSGVTLEEVTDSNARGIGLGVDTVESKSAAAHAGLRSGDIIVAVNNVPLTTIDELTDLIDKKKDARLLLHVRRHSEMLFVVLE